MPIKPTEPKRLTWNTADEIYKLKCELVYQHTFENYYGEGRSTCASLPPGVMESLG
jgi:hypothetical protein